MFFLGGHTTGRVCITVSALHCAVDFGKIEEHIAHWLESLPALPIAMLLAASWALVMHIRMHHGVLANYVTATHFSNLTIGWLEQADHWIPTFEAADFALHGTLPLAVLAFAVSASSIELVRLAGTRRMAIFLGVWLGLSLCTNLHEIKLPPPCSGPRAIETRPVAGRHTFDVQRPAAWL